MDILEGKRWLGEGRGVNFCLGKNSRKILGKN